MLGELLLLLGAGRREAGSGRSERVAGLGGALHLDVAQRFGERLDLAGGCLLAIAGDRIPDVEEGVVVGGRRERSAAVRIMPVRRKQRR